MQPEQSWVLLAHLVRPQGRQGELLADILTDFPERFEERRELMLLSPAATPRPVTLESHWLHKGRIVLKFAGVDSITEADALRGLDVAIPREQRAPLEDSAVYISDLVGCRVFNRTSFQLEEIGVITDVDREITSTPLLVLEDGKGKELLIPFVKAWLNKVDLEAHHIEMTLPEGLLSINEPS